MSRSLRSFASGLGLAVGLGLVASPLISSVTASPPAAIRIASIDLDRTLSVTEEGKRANKEFEKIRKGKQDELDKKQTELKSAAVQLEKQGPVLKAEVRATKKAELEKRLVDLQQLYMELERSLATERSKVIQDLFKKTGPFIKAIAEAEGVHMVIDQSAVVWGVPALDLTSKLIARMDQKK